MWKTGAAQPLPFWLCLEAHAPHAEEPYHLCSTGLWGTILAVSARSDREDLYVGSEREGHRCTRAHRAWDG